MKTIAISSPRKLEKLAASDAEMQNLLADLAGEVKAAGGDSYAVQFNVSDKAKVDMAVGVVGAGSTVTYNASKTGRDQS